MEDPPSAADELLATQFREVIDALPDGVAVHREGIFVFANPATERILRYGHGELLGMSVLDVVHPDERSDIATRMRTLLRTGDPVPIREERLLAKDGQEMVCLVRGMPVKWGGANAALIIAQDVTELRRYEERLAMADRLASVGTLAAGMAHDLNNPLAALVLALDLAGEVANADGPIPAIQANRVRRRIGGALAAAERLKEIVGDLRVFARQPDETERLVDVAAPVQHALDLARNELRHRCRLETRFDPTPPVLASEGRMVQVFLNLIMNAIQAFPEDRPAEANVLRVTCDTVGAGAGEARVAVEDNGVGIPQDQVHRVFEPYFTTKPAGQGTGLGLWMVHGVVRRLGGRVALKSELGRGTTVEVFVPVGVSSSRTPDPPPAPVGQRKRVLVVDDEVEIADLVAEVLRLGGHQVDVFTRGVDALAAMRSSDWDVAICDLMMPDLGGRELYEALVADGRDQERRLIFATGGAFTSSAAEFLDRVEARVLHKPFRLSEVRLLVDRWPTE